MASKAKVVYEDMVGRIKSMIPSKGNPAKVKDPEYWPSFGPNFGEIVMDETVVRPKSYLRTRKNAPMVSGVEVTAKRSKPTRSPK